MSALAEVQAAVDALPAPQQEELFQHLAQILQKDEKGRRLPLVRATGHQITQQNIDDALDSD